MVVNSGDFINHSVHRAVNIVTGFVAKAALKVCNDIVGHKIPAVMPLDALAYAQGPGLQIVARLPLLE